MASTAIMIGGLGATSLSDRFMCEALGGAFAGNDWERQSVTWPAQAGPMLGRVSMGESVAVGTDNMLKAIKATYKKDPEDPITVFGMSEGSAVVDEVMRALANDPTAPPSGKLNFIVAGDANHRQAGFIPHTYGGYKFQPPAQTPYDLTVLTYEYDGWADWPDDPWNLLAARNALAGALMNHNETYFVDLSELKADQTLKPIVKRNASGGFTTYYLIPTETLPLVVMNPRLAPREEELKRKIDAAYSRNDGTAPGATGSSEPPTSVPGNPTGDEPIGNLFTNRINRIRERAADTLAARKAERESNADARAARWAEQRERAADTLAARKAERESNADARAARRAEQRASTADARAARRAGRH
ncbi:MAG TPA: PE-PPE domain-containing protein [Mycobacterium sp.]